MRSPRSLLSVTPGAGSGGRPSTALQVASGTVWLGFLAFPIADTFSTDTSTAERVLAAVGSVVFAGTYLTIISCWPTEVWQRRTRLRARLYCVLIGVSLALTLGVHAVAWGSTFVYCAACAAIVTSSSLAFWLMLLCVALAIGGTLIAGQPVYQALAEGGLTLGIGLLLLLVRDLRSRNAELSEARAELARLAVARERERFARDLHDLLGHTLSVIAIKTELAGRLLAPDPDRAAKEIAEVEQVARQALGEVREAVSGYRRPTLDGELAGARVALSAAGIDVEIARAQVAFDPAVEEVLAWAIREGATNVIRHSRARRCTLRVTATLSGAGIEVLDDGPHGATAAHDSEGHGIDGVRERVAGLEGTVAAGQQAGGGYRLSVTVPLTAAVRLAEPLPGRQTSGRGSPR